MTKVVAPLAANVAMKNRVTIRSVQADRAHHRREPGHVPTAIITATVATAILLVAATTVFSDQGLFGKLVSVLMFAGPAILCAAIFLQRANNNENVSRNQIRYDDELANTVPWSAMRPHVTGESRNCKISQHSTANHLMFVPIFTLQYVLLVIAAVVLAGMVYMGLTGSLPHLPYINEISSIDPSLKAFIYLFGATALFYTACLLRKPVRALEFDKNKGVFWIEKQRIFGWKVGESAQMPISQIYALQIISYTNREAYLHYKDQIAAQGHKRPSFVGNDQKAIKEYEVNVIFRNGERVNIINHRNGKAIKMDAATLGEFLDIPVWDREQDVDKAYQQAAAK